VTSFRRDKARKEWPVTLFQQFYDIDERASRFAPMDGCYYRVVECLCYGSVVGKGEHGRTEHRVIPFARSRSIPLFLVHDVAREGIDPLYLRSP
jgi:hypothetical protein